jgi:hypothetical protein
MIRSDGWTTEVTATNVTDATWRASSNFTHVILRHALPPEIAQQTELKPT